MKRKGIFIPALAFLAIVLFVIIVLATIFPSIKQTIIDILTAGK